MIIRFLVIVLAAFWLTVANAFSVDRTVVVGIMDGGPLSQHEQTITAILERSLAECPSVKIKSYPIFKNKKMTAKIFNNAIDQVISDGVDVVNLSWNDKYSEDFELVVKNLRSLAKHAKLVMAAGENKRDPKHPMKIKDTVAGQIPEATVVGEANAQGQVAINSNYGPEMDRVVAPPMCHQGSSFSVPLVVAKMACPKSSKL